MINDNDIDYGEYYSESEETEDYYQECSYNERTRELTGQLTWGEE